MKIKYKIIRHLNPEGKTIHYRAIYHDENGVKHQSPCYTMKNKSAGRCAQNWLYANIHRWCNVATVEQRLAKGKAPVFVRTEKLT